MVYLTSSTIVECFVKYFSVETVCHTITVKSIFDKTYNVKPFEFLSKILYLIPLATTQNNQFILDIIF